MCSLIALMLKAEPDKFPWAAPFLPWVQSTAWLTIPCLAVVAVLCGVVKSHVGSPWVWKVVHSLLDDLREGVFNGSNYSSLGEHRATLFKFCPCCPGGWRILSKKKKFWLIPYCKLKIHGPLAGWLIPAERSSHNHRKSSAIFIAHDDSAHAEGVVGTQWHERESIHIEDLPEIGANASVQNIERYCTRSFTSIERVKKMIELERKMPRSFHSIRIIVGGKPWGVVVLDSTHDKMPPKEEITKVAKPICGFLSKVLERL